MNIIKLRQEERNNKIQGITNSIKLRLDEGKMISYDDLVIASMGNFHVARRTAMEYIEVAVFNLGIKKENLNDEKFVTLWKEMK